VARRFHGAKELDPIRLAGEAGTIAEEIVQHLTKLGGSKVDVRIEIGAEVPDGVPDESSERFRRTRRRSASSPSASRKSEQEALAGSPTTVRRTQELVGASRLRALRRCSCPPWNDRSRGVGIGNQEANRKHILWFRRFWRSPWKQVMASDLGFSDRAW
jgi:hypothetical protein